LAEEEAKKAEEKTDPGKAEGKKPGESPWASLLTEAAKKLMPIFLTGASLVGFVAFAGAVIVWTRFDAIGVPADQAVKAVPRSELVATGSSLLLLFGFFGLLAVLATFLVDRGGRPTPGMSRTLLLIVAIEGIIAVVLADGVPVVTKLSITLGFLTFVGLAIVATFDKRFATYADELGSRDGETKDPVRGPDSLHTALGNLRISVLLPICILLLLAALGALAGILVFEHPRDIWRFGTWLLVVVFGVALPVLLILAWNGIEANKKREAEEEEAYKTDREIGEAGLSGFIKGVGEWIEERRNPKSKAQILAAMEEERLGKPRPHRLALRFWGVCLLVGLAVAAIAAPALIMGQWWLAVSFGAAFILAAGVWRVAILSKPSFMWYGLVVFLSVPLFGTCTLMARNVSDPQVQPLAMIRSTDGPGESIQGIYVTEGSDRVYFANVATEGCENKVRPDSGRLLWVPKKEVVAMSVGPLQDVDAAGRSALEMAYALTPDVETPTGERVSLAVAEKAEGGGEGDESGRKGGGAEEAKPSEGAPKKTGGVSSEEDEKKEKEQEEDEKKKEEEEEFVADGHRLGNAGPAVRPNFGAGLKIVPAAAEPGDVVELRMSVSNPEVEGFKSMPSGYALRLNGVRLAVLRVPALGSDRAEYVKTVGGKVLRLDWYTDTEAAQGGFVRLEEESATEVTDGYPELPMSLRLRGPGKLAPLSRSKEGEIPPNVTLPSGEVEDLQYTLLRRAWSPSRIKFRVPDNATTGVVSVECGQLAGQPVLTVVNPPIARVSVKMRPGSERITFDSSHSVEEGEGDISRHWTIAGRNMGGEPEVAAALPARLTPYLVSLTMTDSRGLSDTVELRVLRLPYSHFPFGSKEPVSRKRDVRRVRKALSAAVDEEKPVAIELDGHADAVGADKENLGLSLERAERLRELVFTTSEASGEEEAEDDDPRLVNRGTNVPMIVRAFGESCPIIRTTGPEAVNRRVEVFLLGPGATVGAGRGCHSDRIKRTSW
jgi:hypothetical protein